MSRREEVLLRDQRGPAKMNPFIVVAKESNTGDPRPESDWIELRMVLSSRDKVGVCNLGFPANGFSWKKNCQIVAPVANAMKVLQAWIYKYANTGLFLNALIVKFNVLMLVFTFRYEVLKLSSTSIINLTILEASSDHQNIYRHVKKACNIS